MAAQEYFLRQDSLFVETADGVFLRGSGGDSFLKGKAVHKWLVALAPRLSVGCGLAELCEGLDDQRRGMVVRLLDRLQDAGFVQLREVEAEDLLPEPVERRFAEQISFLRHDGDRPKERFRRWREARVMVVGRGPAAVGAVRSLLRNGAYDITVAWRGDTSTAAAWDEDLSALADAGAPARMELFRAESMDILSAACAGSPPDAVILTPEERDPEFREALLKYSCGMGSAFVSAAVAGKYLVKGPLVPGNGTSCWGCAEIRLAGNPSVEKPETGEGKAEAVLYPAVLAATGSELALEVFRHIAAEGPSGLEGAMVIQDPLSLAGRREALPADPRCRFCAPQVTLPETLDALYALAEGRLDLPAEPEERYERYRSALAETTGPLRRFDDSSVPQTAVKAGVVRAAGPDRPAFAGFHAESLTEARCAAVERAARWSAATAPAPLATASGTRKSLAGQGQTAVAPDSLAALQHQPGADLDENRPTRWTPALSLLDRRTVWVPAGLLSGEAPDGSAALSLSGYGAGATFTSLAVEGILSALLHESVQARRATAAGPPPARIPLGDAAAESGLPIVRGLARTGELTFTELAAAGPARVVTARHATPDATVEVAAAGVDRGEAVRTALVELAGRLQYARRDAAAEPSTDALRDGGRSLLRPVDRPPLEPTAAAVGVASAPAPASDEDRLSRLLDGLRAAGRDALLVATPPAALGGVHAPLRVGRVLLTL